MSIVFGGVLVAILIHVLQEIIPDTCALSPGPALVRIANGSSFICPGNMIVSLRSRCTEIEDLAILLTKF
jgi:hypothetical protein